MKTNAKERARPEIKYYLTAVTSSDHVFAVPCFSLSECALVYWYLTTHACYREIKPRSAETFKGAKIEKRPELVREAAEKSRSENVKRIYLNVLDFRKKQYLISATARRILTPPHSMKQAELVKEQVRRSS